MFQLPRQKSAETVFSIFCLQPLLHCVHKRRGWEVNEIQSSENTFWPLSVSVSPSLVCAEFKLRETFFATAINVLSLLALYFFPCSVLCCCFALVVHEEEENNRIDTWAGKLKRLYSSFRLMRCIICLCVLYLHDSLWISLSSSCYEVASTLYLESIGCRPSLWAKQLKRPVPTRSFDLPSTKSSCAHMFHNNFQEIIAFATCLRPFWPRKNEAITITLEWKISE